MSRQVPYNLSAEESLLGAMLLDTEAVGVAVETVTAEDFYRPNHGHIFEAIRSLFARNEKADPVTVGDELKRAALLDTVGGLAALLSLQVNTPSTSNVGRYARIVADHSLSRRLIGVAGEIAELGYESADVSASLEKAWTLLDDVVAHSSRSKGAVRIGDSLNEWLETFELRQGTPNGQPTQWRDLDAKLVALEPGQLIVVGGRPGMGKSSWAEALAVNIARAGRPALIVSAEMHLTELQDRYAANLANLPLSAVRKRELSDAHWARLSNALAEAVLLPIDVVDDPNASLNAIRAVVRRLARRDDGLGVVIVDYLQLIKGAGRAENRQLEVAELSRELKRLARQTNVPVVAISSLSRAVEARGEKRPVLSDLRESGNIEADADVVLLLYRDEVYDPKSSQKGICEVIVAKQRNGPTGTVKLLYDASTGRFRDIPQDDKGEPLSMTFGGA